MKENENNLKDCFVIYFHNNKNKNAARSKIGEKSINVYLQKLFKIHKNECSGEIPLDF